MGIGKKILIGVGVLIGASITISVVDYVFFADRRANMARKIASELLAKKKITYDESISLIDVLSKLKYNQLESISRDQNQKELLVQAVKKAYSGNQKETLFEQVK